MWLIFRQVQTLSRKTFQMICCFNIMRGSDVYWLSHRTSYNRLVYIHHNRGSSSHHSLSFLYYIKTSVHLVTFAICIYALILLWYIMMICSQAWMLLSNHKFRNYNFSIDFLFWRCWKSDTFCTNTTNNTYSFWLQNCNLFHFIMQILQNHL